MIDGIPKMDCFAYDKRHVECIALDNLYCRNKECNFYKTKKQNDEELKKYQWNI